MKVPAVLRFVCTGSLTALLVALLTTPAVRAVPLQWDGSDTATAGAQGGTGDWNMNLTANWWDSVNSTDIAWPNAGPDNDAIFGGTAGGLVTVTTVTANDLTFSTTDYTLAGTTITLNGTTNTLTTDAGVAATINSALAGNDLLVKAGDGTLTLQTASTRTGATQIDGGVLRLENPTALGTTAAAITVNAGTLAIATSTTIGNGSSITLNTGATITNGLAANVRIDKLITLAASGTPVVGFDSGTTSTNVLTINGGGNTRLTGGVTGAQIQIKGSGEVDVGETGQTRTHSVIADWCLQAGKLRIRGDGELGAAANDLYFQGGTLATDAAFTLGATRVLDFNHASGGTVDTTGGSLTLGTAGQLTGFNRLNKTGNNLLILSAANLSFSGEVNITGGTVRANDGTGVNSGSPLTLNGGVFETGISLARNGGSNASEMQILGGSSGFSAQGAAVQVAFGTLASPAALTWGSAPFAPASLVLNATTANNSLLFLNAVDLGTVTRAISVDANVATLSGVLSGAGGGLVKSGAGSLVLTGANSYTGTTTLSGGLLNAGVAETSTPSGPFGVPATVAGSIIFNGGTLQYSSANTHDYSARFTTSGNNPYSIDTNAQTVTFLTGLAANGTSGLTKLGAGTLILATANTYAGATTVNAGTLQSTASGALPAGTNVTVSGNAAGVTTTLDLNGYSSTIGTLALGGATATSGAAVLTGTGVLTLGGDLTYTATNNPLGATISGSLDLGTATRTFTINDSTTAAIDLTVSAGIAGSGVGLTKAGAGMLVLSGTNTYSGPTTLNSGTLKVPKAASLYNDTGDMATWTRANLTIDSSATLAVNYGGGGSDLTQAQVATVLANLATSVNNNGLKAGASFGFDTANATGGATYANVFADSTGSAGFGAVGLTKLGANTLTLTAANTYSGPTSVLAGILQAGIASVANTSGAFGNHSAVTLANVAGVALDLNGFDTQIGSLAGGGGSGGNVTLGAATLTTGSNNTSTTYAGVISSSGSPLVSLRKIGSGQLTLQRANTYTGKTVIDGGTLAVDQSNGTIPDAKLGAVPASLQADNISLLNGATLFRQGGTDNQGNFHVNRGIYLGAGTQTITNQGGDLMINGVISGPGGLLHAGGSSYSILILNAANTFTGDTKFLTAGTSPGYIRLGNALALQNSAFDTSGQVNLDCGGAITLGGITNGSAPTGNNLPLGNVTALSLNLGTGVTKTYSGALSGKAGMTLEKKGAGTQVFAGANTYTGTTTVTEGTLQLGNGGTTGSLAISSALVNNGTLAFKRSNTFTQGVHFNGAISGSGHVIQAGSGTLELTGTNSYSGNTTVADGILAIAEPYLADGSTITINTAARLVLNFNEIGGDVTDTVSKLVIGSTQMPAGIYGATGSGAPPENIDDTHFAGAGTLTVTSAPGDSPYAIWAQSHITALDPAADATPGGNPDHDAHSNLLEFAFNGDPLSGADSGKVHVLTSDSDGDTLNELILTVAVRQNTPLFSGDPSPMATSTVDGITYAIAGSTTLSGFPAKVNVLPTPVIPAADPDPGSGYVFRSFSLDGSNGLHGKGFLRASASQHEQGKG